MNEKMYDELTREELVQRIISLEKIECADRCFANECQSGTSIYRINELFSALASGKITEAYKVLKGAEEDWNFIKSGIVKMNNNWRI